MGYLKYVNIQQGSRSVKRFSSGNTLPLVQRPFGFASFTAQTDTVSRDRNWFYHPDDRSLEGIRMTHQPSPWITDKVSIAFLPQRGQPHADADKRWSGIKKEETVLQPHYMRYVLTRMRAVAELTPTERGACMRVQYEGEDNWFSILSTGESCGFVRDGDKITGYTRSHTNRCHFKMYFVAKFPEGVIEDSIIEGDQAIHVKVKTKNIEVRIAASFISAEQAELNLAQEEYACFDALKAQNEQIWEERLSRISVESKDEEMLRTFYSCLYRAYLFPRKAHEIDENGEKVHFQPETGTVEKGPRYTDNGFWDTYRTVYSMLPLIAKDDYLEMLESFLLEYKECGWLPRWTAMEAVNCMPSTAIDMVLADAAARGALTTLQMELALEAMLKHANHDAPVAVYGREGCEAYLKYGYVPCDQYKESVNLSLDAAYGDHCIASIAEKLGKAELAKEYYARSKNYRNVFDATVGFMRGRKTDGSFEEEFDPYRWGGSFTEAGTWQTTFAVQHDLIGLAQLFGGREGLLKKLDEHFSETPHYDVGGYGAEIHEMTEMAAADWGQCAISNQPSFHIPFIYAYFGQKDKSTKWLERICREGFSAEDDGFPGDEDNGTTACWYMFAVMGFYPLRVGNAKYVRTGMLVDNVRIMGRTVEELVEFETADTI